MPTDYTAGILDGKITTFPQFAKLCMRAFWATIHMRDEDLYAEYEERKVSQYYIDKIKVSKQILEDMKIISDESLIINEKKSLEEEKQNFTQEISKKIINLSILNKMLEDVISWQAPTNEYTGFKNFMIEQLQSTINHDCNTEYYYNEIKKIDLKLNKLDAKQIREENIENANIDIEYCEGKIKEETERCNDSNKWVSDLFNSLKKI